MLYLCSLISSFHSTLVDGVEMQKKYGNVKKLSYYFPCNIWKQPLTSQVLHLRGWIGVNFEIFPAPYAVHLMMW